MQTPVCRIVEASTKCVLLAALWTLAQFVLASQPLPEGTEAHTPRSPDREELGAQMTKAISSTPVLHLKVKSTFQGDVYESEGWMTVSKAKGVVRRDGTVVFATCFDGRRVQEYAPQGKFQEWNRSRSRVA